jgi:hypothetical protein
MPMCTKSLLDHLECQLGVICLFSNLKKRIMKCSVRLSVKELDGRWTDSLIYLVTSELGLELVDIQVRFLRIPPPVPCGSAYVSTH